MPTEVEAAKIAAELDRLNSERQAIETAMLDEAIAEADAEIAGGPGPVVLITASPRWHAGVVGLIAARLRERFQRPAIAIAFGANGEGQGSGRSIPGVDLGRAIRAAAAQGILIKGGGHAMAAGLTIAGAAAGRPRGVPARRTPGASAIAEAGDDGGLAIDAALNASGATVDLIDLVERAGPFGAGHAEPVFALPAHRVAYAEVRWATRPPPRHACRRTMAARRCARCCSAARASPLGQAIAARRGQALHVAGTLSVDQWQGQRRPSLRILDAAEPNAAAPDFGVGCPARARPTESRC